MIMSRHQNAGQNHNLLISFESLAKFTYFWKNGNGMKTGFEDNIWA
jgi:hypothetical protein